MELSLSEIARYLRMGRELPTGALAQRVVQLRNEALTLMRPARVWRRVELSFYPESKHLASHLAGCREAYLVCGTLGPAIDAWQRYLAVNSGANAFIAQAVGAAAIEKWMDMVETEICRELKGPERLRARYSPGYGDFPLAAQRDILRLLDAPRAVGVSLTPDLLMVPSKSVSAVIGLSID